MVITRIQSIEINNDEWESLEEYFEKSRDELELEEITDLQVIYGDGFWHCADTEYLYDKIEER